MSRVVAVIPARMAASRFPGKPLVDIEGLPMIMHCYLRTKLAECIDEVVIATCDRAIFEVADRFGAPVVMTSSQHLNAVDRTAEAVQILQDEDSQPIESVLLVQGDEPLLDPRALDSMVLTIQDDLSIDFLNIMVPFADHDSFMDYNCPKVVINEYGNAMYISREPIPSAWHDWDAGLSHMQTGLFAFRPEALAWFAATSRTDLEKSESIDMLRVLFHGRTLRMLRVDEPTLGVDTPEDLARAIELMQSDLLFPTYR